MHMGHLETRAADVSNLLTQEQGTMVDPLKRTSKKYRQTTPRREVVRYISNVAHIYIYIYIYIYIFNSCVLYGRHKFVPYKLHYYKANGTPDITQHTAISFVKNSKRDGHYSVRVADLNKPFNVLWRNNGERLCNHCCSAKSNKYYTFCGCVCSLIIQHAVCIRYTVVCGLSGSTIFSHIISKTDKIFGGKKVS